MTHEILSGPDFLNSVADAEAANGNHINAAEYRRRAAQWRDDQRDCMKAQADLMLARDTSREDADLLDFLADRDQHIANVTLPTWAVVQNLASLRAAIRAVMNHAEDQAASEAGDGQQQGKAHG